MQVKDFIKNFGIESLNGKSIEKNGKIYKIELSPDDLHYHSINNTDWNNSKERLDKYHTNGNFRFYAMGDDNMCVWVYPTSELIMENQVTTKYGKIAIINEGGIRKVDFNKSKFNTVIDFIAFLRDKNLTKKILNH